LRRLSTLLVGSMAGEFKTLGEFGEARVAQ
jgi:hypothetical protein